MKFLVDAQLPRRLSLALISHGHEAVHTLDLPQANTTPDSEISRISLEQSRVVISKDADFVNDFLLRGQPFGLLLISTGNISNDELLTLIETNLQAIVSAFESNRFVELTREALVVHQ